MNNIPNAKLRLSCKPEGNDTEVTLTAQWDGVVLAVDKLDLAKPRQCASFVKRVSCRNAITSTGRPWNPHCSQ